MDRLSLKSPCHCLASSLLIGSILSCGGGGGGGGPVTPANSLVSFSTISGSSPFFGVATNRSRAVEKRTGPSLSGLRDMTGMGFDPARGVMYGYMDRARELVRVDLDTGEPSFLGHLSGGITLQAMTIDASTGTLYGIDQERNLCRIDPLSRDSSVIGNLGNFSFTSLAYDPTGHCIYTIQRGTETQMFRVDLATAESTPVGGPLAASYETVAIVPATGQLYALDFHSGDFVMLDKTNGSATLLGESPFSQMRAMAYHAPSDSFYSVARPGNQLVRFDRVTGIASSDAGIGFSSISGMAYDPSTQTLFAIENAGDKLITIDRDKARGRVIGDLGFYDVQALAWDPERRVLYGSDLATTRLISIDPLTGAGTSIGSLELEEIRSLAYDSSRRVLYGIDMRSRTLFDIDTSDASLTAIMDVPATDMEALTFDSLSGKIYGVDSHKFGGHLFEIKPLERQAAYIGPTGMQGTSALASNPGAGILYGNHTSPAALLSIDPASGRARGINHPGFFRVESLAYDPERRIHYAVADRKRLIEIDRETGTGMGIGELGFTFVGGLTFDPNSRVLYLADQDGFQLLRVDTVTGAASPVGPFGLDIDLMAFDSRAAVLYGIGSGDRLYTVDTATGMATEVGSLAVGGVFDLTYDPATDSLLALTTEGFGAQLLHIDRDTGEAKQIWRFDAEIEAISNR